MSVVLVVVPPPVHANISPLIVSTPPTLGLVTAEDGKTCNDGVWSFELTMSKVRVRIVRNTAIVVGVPGGVVPSAVCSIVARLARKAAVLVGVPGGVIVKGVNADILLSKIERNFCLLFPPMTTSVVFFLLIKSYLRLDLTGLGVHFYGSLCL